MYNIIITIRVLKGKKTDIFLEHNSTIEDVNYLLTRLASEVIHSLSGVIGAVKIDSINIYTNDETLLNEPFVVDIHLKIPENDLDLQRSNDEIEYFELLIESALSAALLEVFDHIIVEKVFISQDTRKNLFSNAPDFSTIDIQITNEPLTAQNLSNFISVFGELHTKCWLIEQKRFADLITYTLTRNPNFSEEAPLIIAKITHNSPIWLNFIPNSKVIAEALVIALDGVCQAPLRVYTKVLDNRAKKLEIKLKEQEAMSKLAGKDQARQIEAQKAEIAIQKELLGLEKEQLQIEKERFEFETKRFEYLVKTSHLMVNKIRPDADEGTKAMLSQALVNSLSQLSNGIKLERALPPPKEVKPTDSN